MQTLYEFEQQGVTVTLLEDDETNGVWEVQCEHCGESDNALDFHGMLDSRYEHLDRCAGGDTR